MQLTGPQLPSLGELYHLHVKLYSNLEILMMMVGIIVIMLSVCSGYKLPIWCCPGSALYGCKLVDKKWDQSDQMVS